MGAAEPAQAGGQRRAGQGPHERQRDRSVIRPVQRLDGFDTVAHRRQQRFSVREEGAAGLGQACPAARAVEEPLAHLPLEQVEPPADRGLREMERRCRAGEAAAAEDRDEGLDVVDLHGHEHS